jgi:hypothetical protein
MTGRTNEEAVSVIVGTLLLILITVTAAAGLAIMVAQLQKNEMDQQSHIAAVKSEQIDILNPGLTNDASAWSQTHPPAWNQIPFNVSGNQSWKNWSSVTISLSNLNTDDVNVIGIAINDHYTRNFTAITTAPIPVRVPYNISDHDYLKIPGSKSQKIQINITDDFPSPLYINDGDPVKITVMTSLYNTFVKNCRPPNPVIHTKTETEDYDAIQRRVLFLDGSASTADNGIADWNWTIVSAANTVPPGTWTDSSNHTTSYSRGETVRVSPMDPGPFRIVLKMTDDVGMTRVSDPVDIPADQNYVPVSNVYASSLRNLNQSFVNVTVKDINGKPVSGVTVNFAMGSNPYNNITFSPYFAQTDSAGNATTIATDGIGTIKVIYGKFPVIDVPVGL